MGNLDSIDNLSFAPTRRSLTKGAAAGDPANQHGLSMSVPLEGVPLSPPTRRRDNHLSAKRIFDVWFSAAALMTFLPLFAIVALCIKVTSRGPVFFRQKREGHLGAPFLVFKFRSMRPEDCETSGVSQVAQDDPRVTALGRFLRRTSIDELPQLINVLIGEMSLVGPRPHVPGMRAGPMNYRELVPYYDRRLDMVPGITGWAQANGLRGATDDADASRARIDHDIAYIQNFSFWLDLRIIALTLRREFLGGSGV